MRVKSISKVIQSCGIILSVELALFFLHFTASDASVHKSTASKDTITST